MHKGGRRGEESQQACRRVSPAQTLSYPLTAPPRLVPACLPLVAESLPDMMDVYENGRVEQWLGNTSLARGFRRDDKLLVTYIALHSRARILKWMLS